MKYLDLTYAAYNMEPKLSKTKKWFGTYKGIDFEINNFDIGPDTRNCWTHYIILNLDKQLPSDIANKFWLERSNFHDEKRVYYEYYEEPISLLEFHGGCTWYSKESGFDGADRVVKIGCDYQHYWDEGYKYDLDYVYNEVKATIESLYKIEKKIKFWNSGDGIYRTMDEYKK